MSALTAESRDLIDGSQRALLAVYPPEEVYSLSAEELEAPDIRFYVARLDGTARGCVAALEKPGYVEVKRLYVAPEARGHGLSRRLMQRLESDAARGGRRLVRLETGPDLQAAVSLYRRMGYSETGPFGEYPDHPSSLFMEKALDRAMSGAG